ncbi:dihydrofolate reductase [Nitzschia inconspicua]|uniref:dihydrofolate reductase n=1 Tax=Nitzschia inconspicua TaxID=303405 RepID=A0A9K3PIM5_9STRA|nr:dihydrofolate reductase [Nitzschia inconspicua]
MTATSRIIGIAGMLPWKSTMDRKLFQNLTNDRILIVGRKTLQEEQNRSLGHVRHAKFCIVVSTTVSNVEDLMTVPSIDGSKSDQDWIKLRVAASLDEALDMARQLQDDIDHSEIVIDSNRPSNLNCWVAGGERLFEEALKHPSASELHLSVVDVDVNIDNVPMEQVARFPAKYRWDHNYKETSCQRFDETSVPSEEPTFTYHVFERIQRNKS